VAGAAAGATAAAPNAHAMRNYFVDMLFRTDRPLEAREQDQRAVSGGIVANAPVQATVAGRSDLSRATSQPDGLAGMRQRVTKTVTAAKLAADAAKAGARSGGHGAQTRIHGVMGLRVVVVGVLCRIHRDVVGGGAGDTHSRRSG
jgi:hypothetical protein